MIGVNIVPVAAFVGAGAAVAGAYALGRTVGGLRSTTGLILAGVAIAAFFNSIQIYVQQSQTGSIRQVYSWILGRLSTAGWDGVILVLPYVVLSVAIIFLHRRLLDALAIGDSEVTNLGISVRRVRDWNGTFGHDTGSLRCSSQAAALSRSSSLATLKPIASAAMSSDVRNTTE